MLFRPVVIELKREPAVVVNQSSLTAVNEVNAVWQSPYPYGNIKLIFSFPDLFMDKASLPLIPVRNMDRLT